MIKSKIAYDRRSLDIIKRIFSRWGFSIREGIIYGILLLSPRSLTIREIIEITGMSRSSISTSLNILMREYMVDVRRKGKTKLFSPIPSFYEKFMEQPSELLEKEVIPLKKRIGEILKKVDDEEYRNKLINIIENLDSLENMLVNIMEIEKRKLKI